MKKLYEYLPIIALLSPLILFMAIPIVIDFTDPPFIANKKYDITIFWIIPIISGALFIYLNMLVFKKYKQCSKYRESFKHNISGIKNLASFIFGYLAAPFLIYAIFYIYLALPIKLFAYFTESDYWYKEYILTDVEECGSDYENSCTRLSFLDPKTKQIHELRWYEEKSSIINSKGHYVYVIGEASYFGYIVRRLER